MNDDHNNLLITVAGATALGRRSAPAGGSIYEDLIMKVYTLLKEMCEGCWIDEFSFHAKDKAAAMSKARQWANYHGMSNSDVDVRPATAEEIEHRMHDEHMD